MITKLTQNLEAGDKYNMSQIGYDPITITSATRLDNLFVRLEGTRDADGSIAVCTVLADIEIFQ